MELKIFKARGYLLDRVYNLFYNFQKEQIGIERKRSAMNMLWDIVGAVGYVAVYMIIIMSVIAKQITIGQFSFYVGTSRTLQSAFNRFFGRLGRVYEHGLYVVDVFEVLDMKEKVVSG